MKEKRKANRNIVMTAVLAVIFIVSCISVSEYEAAMSFTNAKEFFENTGQDGKHAKIHDATIYFATQAKVAASSSNKRYHTLGFDVVMTGNGKSIRFSVKRDGSLTLIDERTDEKKKYTYLLYKISTEHLYRLATETGDPNVNSVLSASQIDIRMDAIMTTIENGAIQGQIEENGAGGIRVIKEPVYHLNNSSDHAEMMDIFTGHKFESYTKITLPLRNYDLTVMYQVGTDISLGNNYSVGNVSVGSSTLSGMLYDSIGVVRQTCKTMQKFELIHPQTIKLKKTGYHLGKGTGTNEVWRKADGTTYDTGVLYSPKELDINAGTKPNGIVLYANWKPNTYAIEYNASGGKGTVAPSKMTYDEYGQLRNNTFTKQGYYLPEGNEWVDANGNTYANGEIILNWTEVDKETITLYANWKPIIVKVDLDKQGGTGGTDAFWQKYGIGFFEDESCTNDLNIVLPNRDGYTFKGYYKYVNGGLPLLVEETGQLAVLNTFFTKSTTAFANWEANHYTVTFDKQGGEYGTDSVEAIYDKVFPVADAAQNPGYTFLGYYTKVNGKGICIYNEFMASDTIFNYTEDITLYAYWVDNTPAEVTLTVSHDKWTNQKVTLTADAKDYGEGLRSLIIYQIGTGGKSIRVAGVDNLNGTKTKELTFVNTTEGIVRYKAVATDMSGNEMESYNVVYYDTKAPTGTVIAGKTEDEEFYFEIDITDINNGN